MLPIIWSIADLDGKPITDPAYFTGISYTATDCETGEVLGDPQPAQSRWGAMHLIKGNWLYLWKTPGSLNGSCITVTLGIDDGVARGRQFTVDFRRGKP